MAAKCCPTDGRCGSFFLPYKDACLFLKSQGLPLILTLFFLWHFHHFDTFPYIIWVRITSGDNKIALDSRTLEELWASSPFGDIKIAGHDFLAINYSQIKHLQYLSFCHFFLFDTPI